MVKSSVNKWHLATDLIAMAANQIVQAIQLGNN